MVLLSLGWLEVKDVYSCMRGCIIGYLSLWNLVHGSYLYDLVRRAKLCGLSLGQIMVYIIKKWTNFKIQIMEFCVLRFSNYWCCFWKLCLLYSYIYKPCFLVVYSLDCFFYTYWDFFENLTIYFSPLWFLSQES